MEKKWRDIPTTEISVDPTRVSCRPADAVVLTLRTDATDDVRIELGLPLDVKAEPAELVLRGGILAVRLQAALPGRYDILFKGATGGAGAYLIRTGDKIPHHFDRKPYPIALLEVRWGAARD
jgi:hypothetical protein